jgi:hypothetical protein
VNPDRGFFVFISEIGRRPPGAVISLCFRQGANEARRRPNQFASHVSIKQTISREENLHGRFRRLSHCACADAIDPRRALGEFFVSAEIIQFVPRPRRDRQSDNGGLPRLRPRPDDLVMDHADTAPCEILPMWTSSEGEAG